MEYRLPDGLAQASAVIFPGGGSITFTYYDSYFMPNFNGGGYATSGGFIPQVDTNITYVHVNAASSWYATDYDGDYGNIQLVVSGAENDITIDMEPHSVTEFTWSGNETVSAGDKFWVNIYDFTPNSDASIERIVVTVWMDQNVGGGLLLYPMGGV